MTYEVCVGTTPFGCQVQELTATTGLETSWSSADLGLQCGALHYVAIRATNCAGLQRTVASNGVKVCCQPPIEGSVRLANMHGASVKYVGSSGASVSVHWSGFEDSCSGVREYEVFVIEGGATVWKSASLNASRSHVELPSLMMQLLGDGLQYIAVVRAVSHAGLASNASSSFLVDHTQPVPLHIRAHSSGMSSYHILQRHSCIARMTESITLSWDHWHGAISSALTYRLILLPPASPPPVPPPFQPVDSLSSPPPLPPWTQTASLTAPEGRRVFHNGLKPSAVLQPSQIFTSGQKIAAMVVTACNVAQQCDASEPHTMLFVDEAPVGGNVLLRFEAFEQAKPGQLLAEWSGFYAAVAVPGDIPAVDAEVLPSLAFEVCVGTTPFGCQVQELTATTGLETSWSSADLGLQCGALHYVAIRATNCAGLQRTVASNGVKVCCQPPIEGSVRLANMHGASVKYVGSSGASVSVHWSGFEDSCSGVREYEVFVIEGGATVWKSASLNASRSHVELPSLMMQLLGDGLQYIAVVRAVSHAGLASNASSSFLVDRTPAASSEVLNGGKEHLTCQPASAPVRIGWMPFVDEESGIASISWAVGTSWLGEDLMPPTPVMGDAGTIARQWNSSELSPGMLVYSTLAVRNGAGDVMTVSAAPLRIVPNNSSAFLCLPYRPGPAQHLLASRGHAHPIFWPLVVGLVYNITGGASGLKLPGQRVQLNMQVHIDHMDQSLRARARLMRLQIAKQSLVQDQHGSPLPLDKAIFTHPVMYEQSTNGTILSVYHHPMDTEQSLEMKRMLISAQQLLPARSASDRSENGTIEHDESDVHGPARVRYAMRRGLLGRAVYHKQIEWSAWEVQTHTWTRVDC